MSTRDEQLAYMAERLSDMEPDERFRLEFLLPEGLTLEQADTLGHQIIAEVAEQHPGICTHGNLSRECLRSFGVVPLTWEPSERLKR